MGRIHGLRRRLWILALLFTVSGGTALLAEQVFEKLLSTVVGASTPAATLVLAVYFLGLTLGGLFYAQRWARRVRHPLRLYAALEAFIGLWALLLVLAGSELLDLSSAVVHSAGSSSLGVLGLRLLVAGVWILPPTFAMGATFPAVVGVLRQLRLGRSSHLVPRVYACNLAGATVAALAGPYLVLPTLGLAGTLGAVIAIQGIVALTALAVARGLPRMRPIHRPEIAASTGDSVRVLVMLAFASGFLFFGFEVLWIHLLGTVVGTSVYAFGNMLGAVLFGLFVASALGSWRGRREQQASSTTLAAVLLAAAFLLALTAPGWAAAQGWMLRWGQRIDGFVEGELLRMAISMVLVSVPAIALGMVYPLLFRLPAFHRVQRPDAVAGRLAAANAIGSILGALVTGFGLLPTLGSELTYRLYALVPALAALLVALSRLRSKAPTRPTGRRAAIGLVAAALAVATWGTTQRAWDPLALTSGVNVYFQPQHVSDDSRLLFWHEDLYGGFTTVIERPVPRSETAAVDPGDPQAPPRVRILLTNGKFQGNDGGEMAAQIGFALVPLLYQEARERALVIGLGTGQTATVLADAGFSHLEVAEISPGIVEAAQQAFPHLNQRLWEHPGTRLALEDGRNHLLRSDATYDLVSMELTSVWFAGAGSLYSEEFYRLVARRLADGGVFQQWIQLHHIAPREILSILVTLRRVFPQVHLWYLGHQAIAVASEEPLDASDSHRRHLAQHPDLASTWRLLELLDGSTPETLAQRRLLDHHEIDRLVELAHRQDTPTNTDANRFLEYATPRHNLERQHHVGTSLETLLQGLPESERRQRLAGALRP